MVIIAIKSRVGIMTGISIMSMHMGMGMKVAVCCDMIHNMHMSAVSEQHAQYTGDQQQVCTQFEQYEIAFSHDSNIPV